MPRALLRVRAYRNRWRKPVKSLPEKLANIFRNSPQRPRRADTQLHQRLAKRNCICIERSGVRICARRVQPGSWAGCGEGPTLRQSHAQNGYRVSGYEPARSDQRSCLVELCEHFAKGAFDRLMPDLARCEKPLPTVSRLGCTRLGTDYRGWPEGLGHRLLGFGFAQDHADAVSTRPPGHGGYGKSIMPYPVQSTERGCCLMLILVHRQIRLGCPWPPSARLVLVHSI